MSLAPAAVPPGISPPFKPRAAVPTSVIEAGTMLGGTMTAGSVYMPNPFFTPKGPVVQGIPWELYTRAKAVEGLPIPDYRKRRPVESPGYYSTSASACTQRWLKKRR